MRQRKDRSEPSFRPVLQNQVSAVGAGDVARDAETEAEAAAAACRVAAEERLESALQNGLRNARALVEHPEDKAAGGLGDLDGRAGAVADGVVDEVREAAAQRNRSRGERPRNAAGDPHFLPHILVVGLEALEQRSQVDALE